MFVPTRHGLLQPVDDLLCILGMLSSQSARDNDALHGLGHSEPGTANRRVERHLSSDLVGWFFEHGVMPLYTPSGGFWGPMAAARHPPLVPPPLAVQHPTNDR